MYRENEEDEFIKMLNEKKHEGKECLASISEEITGLL